MSFTITNNSTNAVISAIDALSSTYGSFTVTSGSFPIAQGQSVSGTNTTINNQKGSSQGTILLFLLKGNAQINYVLNGNLISGFDYSSGWCEIASPILSSSDTIQLTILDAENPYPSPTPTPSTTPAPTPSTTPAPTPSSTPSVTPSPTPSSSPAVSLVQSASTFYYAADGSTNISAITGNLYINGIQLTNKTVNSNVEVSFSKANVLPIVSSATTIYPTITLSASPVGYYVADDGTAGVYDTQILSGFTHQGGFEPSQSRWTGTTRFLLGGTLLPYTEAGTIIQQNLFNRTDISGTFDTAYFNVLPNP